MRRRYCLLRRSFATLASVVVLFYTCITVSAQSATICGKYETISLSDDRYIIQNNIWDATTKQCLWIPSLDGTGFEVSVSEHNQNTVAAFPSIFYGCHWGTCTTDSRFPQKVQNLPPVQAVWSYRTAGTSGAWNAVMELWFSPELNTSNGYAGGGELMIWLEHQGMTPSGSPVAHVSLAGIEWEVWYDEIGWNYVAYKALSDLPNNNTVLFNAKEFIEDAVERGFIEKSWYLHVIEAGFEIMKGGRGLASDSFGARVCAAYVSKDGNCDGQKPCYSEIQSAINTESDGTTLRIAQGTYSEDVILGASKSMVLQGGWDSSFQAQSGITTLRKAPRAMMGSLSLLNLRVIPK
ncbi:MAG: hypothetical protein GY846_13005 [Deltaproteobacteria bacterium]|nr:hypothetical protein [Deltaproteobacteria bacterium]